MLPKKTILHFSDWQFVGNAVLKALRPEPPHTISGTQLIAILVTAIHPASFVASIRIEKARELARVFSDFYAAKPDLTLRLLAVIRRKWADTSTTAKAQRLYTTTAYLVRPRWKDGKCVQEGIMMPDASDTDLQTAILGSRAKLKDLANAEAVKKARQRIKLPDFQPLISVELSLALQELNRLGFNTGSGLGYGTPPS